MKIRLYYLKDKFKFLIVYFSLLALVALSTFGNLGFIFSIILTIVLIFYFFIKVNKEKDISDILILPVFLSLFQNTYLGILSPKLSSNSLQFFTILNFVIACTFFVMLLLINKKRSSANKRSSLLLYLILLYSLFTLLVTGSVNILSVLSSLRNVISIFVFFLLGGLASKKVNIDKFEYLILFFGFIVIMIGFYEFFINQDMWKFLNISTLWQKKGIALQPSGLPTNFYSSETLFGERIRRMTSTFADPVNLGSFLFVLFCISWFKNKKIIASLVLVSIVLTVSKGAFLGILIFILMFSLYKKGIRTFLSLIFPVLGVGIAFIVYAYFTSANSVFLHISGFISSLVSLFYQPFGNGLGSTGVLAKQFSGFSSNSSITETGLGMIIGQLGIIGLIIYVVYFILLFRNINLLKNVDEKVLCMTLFLSISINILFNEVALSPNSCALYFIFIGYFLEKNSMKDGVYNERF